MPRGIPNARAEEVRTERRRKTSGSTSGLKLAVPEEMLDRQKFAYRWANDKDNRLQALTKDDDYDIVRYPPVEGETEGKPVTKIVGMSEGKPLLSYLLQKPRTYYDADQKAKQDKIAAVEKEIRRGGTKHLAVGDAETTSGDAASLYTPGGPDGMSGVNIIGDR